MFQKNSILRVFVIKKIILFAVIFAGIFALFFPMFSNNAYAADSVSNVCGLGFNQSCVGTVSGSGSDTAVNWILNIAQWLTGIVVAVSVLYIILGAWFIIVGVGGDGPTYEKGLKVLKNAVFGLVMALLAFTIVYFIGSALDGQSGILSDLFKAS